MKRVFTGLIVLATVLAVAHGGIQDYMLKKVRRPLLLAAATGGAIGLGYGYLVSGQGGDDGAKTHVYNYGNYRTHGDEGIQIINLDTKGR